MKPHRSAGPRGLLEDFRSSDRDVSPNRQGIDQQNSAPPQAPKTHHLDRRASRLIAEGQNANPDDLLTTNQLAEWLGCSRQWLEIARTKGYGPRFIKPSPRRVRYRRCEVLKWLESRTYQCTGDVTQDGDK